MSADHVDEHDLGLVHDLPRIIERNRLGRRSLLSAFGGIGAVSALAACSTDTPAPGADPTASGPASAAPSRRPSATASSPAPAAEPSLDVAAGEIPEEMAGPFPGDGSNGPNILTDSGVVRRDIRRSIGGASGVAEGVPMTVRLRVYDLRGDDATPLAGAAVYLWQCDRAGDYSMYSEAAADENYLRGVQVTDRDGRLEFDTIFPGCYPGRWPHLHFEVYPSLADATSQANRLSTSQLALPQDVSERVYATEGYEQSVGNLADISLDSDLIFADGHSLQMATVAGSVAEGYVATLDVPI